MSKFVFLNYLGTIYRLSLNGLNIDAKVSGGSAISVAVPISQWIHVSIEFSASLHTMYFFSSLVGTATVAVTPLTSPVILSLDIEDVLLRDLHIIASTGPIGNYITYMTKPVYPSLLPSPEVVAYFPCMSLDSSMTLFGFTRYAPIITKQGNMPVKQPNSDPSNF